jgi:head-tail adaptor
MAAGKYRDRATFQRKAGSGLDIYGNPSGAWADLLADVPAWLRETPGKEALAAGRLEAPTTGTLRIMASPSSPARAITAADRVQVRGATWKILGGPIDPEGDGRGLEFTLERGTATQ